MADGGASSGSSTWWWFGIGMNVVGSVGINLGTCLMKRGHNHRECRANNSGMPVEPVRSHKAWQFGAGLFAVGNVLNFISFGYAAQSLLSALGSVQFVSNVIFAHFLLGEDITSQVITGTSIIIGGNLLLVIYGNHQSRVYTAQELVSFYEEIGYQRYVACLLVISTLSYMFYSRGRNKMKRMMVRDSAALPALYRKGVPLCFALASATIGTQSVIFGKSLSTLLRAAWSGFGHLTNWLTGVLLVFLLFTSVFWMVMLNKALRVFDAVVIVPLMQICWIFFSILGGLVYFREYEDFHLIQVYVWLIGCCFILLGVHLLTPPAEKLSVEQEYDEDISFLSSQTSDSRGDVEPTSPSKLGAFAKAAGREAEHLFGHVAKDIKLAYNMATGRDHLLPVTIYSISTMEGACTSPQGRTGEYSAISSSQDVGSSSHQDER